MFVLSDGKVMEEMNASESPVALKKDWPWADISLKMFSALALGDPPPHEQLSCFDKLSVCILLNRSTHGLGLGAS